MEKTEGIGHHRKVTQMSSCPSLLVLLYMGYDRLVHASLYTLASLAMLKSTSQHARFARKKAKDVKQPGFTGGKQHKQEYLLTVHSDTKFLPLHRIFGLLLHSTESVKQGIGKQPRPNEKEATLTFTLFPFLYLGNVAHFTKIPMPHCFYIAYIYQSLGKPPSSDSQSRGPPSAPSDFNDARRI